MEETDPIMPCEATKPLRVVETLYPAKSPAMTDPIPPKAPETSI